MFFLNYEIITFWKWTGGKKQKGRKVTEIIPDEKNGEAAMAIFRHVFETTGKLNFFLFLLSPG